jgi:uncharacterized protein YbjT (DUF2867 family)
VALDFDRPDTIRPALRDVQTLFLLSPSVGVERKVVDEAKRAGVQRIVKLSVMRAADEGFVFARWHRAVEKHIEASGVAWTFLRPNAFMQNVVNHMGHTIRGQSAIYASAADGAVAGIDTRDIGAVAAHVLTERGHEGQAYELTGPAALTYGQIVAVLSRVLGREIRYVPISHEQHRQALLGAGMPADYTDAVIDLNRYYAAGGLSAVSPAVRLITGQDAITFEQFAKDHADQLR